MQVSHRREQRRIICAILITKRTTRYRLPFFLCFVDFDENSGAVAQKKTGRALVNKGFTVHTSLGSIDKICMPYRGPRVVENIG